MSGVFQRTGRRFGIIYRVSALAALGVVGLLVITIIHTAGTRIEKPVQDEVARLSWTYRRFAEMALRLAELRQSETELLYQPGEVRAAQHLIALDLAEAEYRRIVDQPEFSGDARNGAIALTDAVRDYVRASQQIVQVQRRLGLGPEDGARGDLDSATAAFAQAHEEHPSSASPATLSVLWQTIFAVKNGASNAPELVQSAFQNVRSNAVLRPPASDADAAATADASAAIDRLEAALLNDVGAAAALKNASFQTEQAFENASAASTAALGITSRAATYQQDALVALRTRTSDLMQMASLLVTATVIALAIRIGRGISYPLSRVAAITNRLAAGDLDATILHDDRSDEIGEVARALRVFRDSIHEKRLADQKIYDLAHLDNLTGLANRATMNERLASAVAFSRRTLDQTAVLCLDLDGFKAVNDVHGHAAGDELLREVAARLLRTVREVDTVARIGGDEFVILQASATQPYAAHAPATQPGAARALADRVLQALALPFNLEGGAQAQVTVSIGVAMFPSDGGDPATLLRNADTALYRAKWSGKCRVTFFEPDMDREIRDRRALEHDLKLAIERQELFLEWQPLAASGSEADIEGFEVLLRWQHPVRGLIPPDVFVPIAESCGAICDIGLWVLQQACNEAASWTVPYTVAVNVSPIQAQQGETFAIAVKSILESAKLDPDRLELEVTEGVLIRDAERVLQALRPLKAIGVKFALDDFGTGYSSLATLRAFPFDKIKIDRQFTLRGASNDEDCAILRAILGLARGLSLPVVAEGVETPAQLQALMDEGCQQLQGWYIGRPAPIAHFKDRLSDRSVLAAD